MKKNYLFAIIAAVLVVGIGIFLLGRDGTEENSVNLNTSSEVGANSLPISTEISTTSEDQAPILEEGDDNESPVIGELIETSTTTEKESDNGIVFYADGGFSPKTISIEQGDSVTFINNSSRNMWVASNFHPTHNDYPVESDADCLGSSFDACQGIPIGESWSFTFDERGEWGYHDHLNASRGGTVIVE